MPKAKVKKGPSSDQTTKPPIRRRRRRAVTYNIRKNKVLAAKRAKKKARNPRVKHKLKYESALKRYNASRPGAKKDHNRVVYEGELTGINPNLIRSTSIKDTF